MSHKPQILAVQDGGTGVATIPAWALVCGGTTATGALQSVSDVATGQVLISGGTGALPSFSASPALTGIVFPSASGGGSVNSDTLSVYEQGTFTPTVDTSNGNMSGQSYTFQVGIYTRVGNMVHVYIAVEWTNSSAGTGNVVIKTLPYTCKNTANYFPQAAVSIQNITFGSSVLYYTAQTVLNTTTVTLNGVRSASTTLPLATTTFTNAVAILNLTYFV